eukprot:CAMPEP_0177390594 /NCGR_PEP_ID=MMETSP0368-20130122/53265_1 /TAXON_ID=447022 ORGANISM="Scrippsiella hangoei-like, Strain SHHI-4" /NCGR_SAMPLE_ID=MMETSP0368 /ASSEMBLY_ACC=CAM_ASM_000363 /LENGTH=202 /DNA_ID=CAMNT_0018856249 /DNA_START=240 /DNA_END=846 /DNA_ORIENTATION=-
MLPFLAEAPQQYFASPIPKTGPICRDSPLAQLISSTRSAYRGGAYSNLLFATSRHEYFRSIGPKSGPTKETNPLSSIISTREALSGAANMQPFGASTSEEYLPGSGPKSGPHSSASPSFAGLIRGLAAHCTAQRISGSCSDGMHMPTTSEDASLQSPGSPWPELRPLGQGRHHLLRTPQPSPPPPPAAPARLAAAPSEAPPP